MQSDLSFDFTAPDFDPLQPSLDEYLHQSSKYNFAASYLPVSRTWGMAPSPDVGNADEYLENMFCEDCSFWTVDYG